MTGVFYTLSPLSQDTTYHSYYTHCSMTHDLTYKTGESDNKIRLAFTLGVEKLLE